MSTIFIAKNQQLTYNRTKIVLKEEQAPWGGGTLKTRTSVPDGRELVLYDVTLDMDQVAEMALHAARSKGGKCVDGPLKVSIRERREAK